MRTLTIGGTSVGIQSGTVNVSKAANNAPTFSCEIKTTGSFIPALDDEVIWTDDDDDSTILFAGVLTSYDESGFTDLTSDTDAIRFKVYASGYEVFCDRRYVTQTFSAGTTKSMLSTLVTTFLAVYGISLASDQPDGGTLPELTYTRTKASDVMKDLASRNDGYVWRIDEDKKLSLRAPADVSAPYDIEMATPRIRGDISVSERREDWFANKVTIVVTGAGTATATKTFTYAAGTTSYQTDYPAAGNIQGIWPNQLIVNGVPKAPVSWGDQLPGAQWRWDWTTHTLSKDSGATALTDGDVITVTHEIGYPFEASYQDDTDVAAHGPYEMFIEVAEKMSLTAATDRAEQEVNARLTRSRTVTYSVYDGGLQVGQLQHIEDDSRGLDNDFMINEIHIKELNNTQLVYEISAVEGGDTSTFRDVYRLWSGSDSNVGGGVSSVQSSSSDVVTIGVSVPSYVGGSDNTSLNPDSGDWVPLVNSVPIVPSVTLNVTMAVYLWSPDGATVTARIYNVTDSTSVVESDSVTSATKQRKLMSATLTAGKEYRVELKTSTSGSENYGIGILQAA